MNKRRATLIGLAATVGLLWFIIQSTPLIPEQNDSAWYYMNVHYMQTGQYIYESRYPSFTGPCQLYPMGGYSLVILAAKAIGALPGISWIGVLKLLQFAAYILTAYAAFAIASLLGYRRAGIAAATLTLLYFPIFSTVRFVMSEAIAVCLITSVVWMLAKGLLRSKYWALCLSFFLAGWAILFKPVMILTFPLLLAVLVGFQWKQRPWGKWALLGALLLCCPAAQSIANKALFGNFALRSGTGWNMWNRMMFQYKDLLPNYEQSEQLAEVVRDFESKGESPLFDTFASFVWQLSRHGYSQEQTDRICKTIALDGIRTNKLKYLTRTAEISLSMAVDTVYVPRDLYTYNQYGPYFYYLDVLFAQREFCQEQHAPLVAELTSQREYYGRRYMGNIPIRMFSDFAGLYGKLQSMGLHVALTAGYLLWLVLTVARLIWTRAKEHLPGLLVALIPMMVIVGSCLAEAPHRRFKLSVIPLMIIAFCLAVSTLLDLARRKLSS